MDERTSRPRCARRLLLFGWPRVVGWTTLIFVLPAQADLRFLPYAGLDFVGLIGLEGPEAESGSGAPARTNTPPTVRGRNSKSRANDQLSAAASFVEFGIKGRTPPDQVAAWRRP